MSLYSLLIRNYSSSRSLSLAPLWLRQAQPPLLLDFGKHLYSYVVYSSRGWAKLSEIPRIPVVEYALVFLFALLIWGGIMLVGKFRKPRQTNNQLKTAN